MGEAMNYAILDEAMLLQAIGYDIILVDSNKNPGIVKDWTTHKWPESELRSWLVKRDDLSLALRLGEYCDVEIDSTDENERLQLEESFAIRAGLTVSWGSKRGRHWLFKLTPEQRQVLAERNAPSKMVYDGLEFRLGTKPMQSLIPTPGNDYRAWICDPQLHYVREMPNEVWAMLYAAIPAKQRIETLPELDDAEKRPGDIFNERVSWLEILGPHGWTNAYDDKWRHPGKTDGGISATTGYCSSERRGELFWCWSSSTEHTKVEPQKTYSKFELWATLNFEGNMSAAASAAVKSGYTPEINSSCDEFDDFPEIVDFPKQEIEPKQEIVESLKSDAPEPDSLIYDFVLGEYAQKLIPHTEAYPPAILFQLMEVAGILAGRRIYFLHGDYEFRLNGGTIVIGESGISRKGTGLHYARLPFRDDENESTLNDVLSENSQVSGEGFIQAVANKPSHTLLIACEEFASVLKGAKREGSTLSDTLRNALDAKSLGIDSRKNPIPPMNDAFASIIGHCTLDEFIANISLQDIHNGFLNRFQFTMSRQNSKISFPTPVPESVKQPVKDAFAKLMGPQEFAPKVILGFAPDARPVWDAFYKATSEIRSSSRESLAARAPAQVLRNASRIALLEGTTLVDARRLRIALAMLKYSQDCIDYIFGDYINDDEDELIQFLMSDKNGKTLHDVNEWVSRWRKPKRQIKRTITRLTDKGIIVIRAIKTADGAGRPANRLVHVGNKGK